MNTCKYCNKSFKMESTLIKHVCEKKRRHLAMDENHVKVAFKAYVKFYEMTTTKKNITIDDFINSSFYNAFVKFGSFVHNIKPIYPDNFIKYVLTSSVKIDKWCNDQLYEKYVMDLIRSESCDTAMERSIATMMKWGESNNIEWNLYFKEISSSRAMYDIKDGKISPWLLLNCKSGKELLKRMDDIQLDNITNIILPSYWNIKFKNMKSDVQLVKDIVKETGI